jgi:hypothetical protein
LCCNWDFGHEIIFVFLLVALLQLFCNSEYISWNIYLKMWCCCSCSYVSFVWFSSNFVIVHLTSKSQDIVILINLHALFTKALIIIIFILYVYLLLCWHTDHIENILLQTVAWDSIMVLNWSYTLKIFAQTS